MKRELISSSTCALCIFAPASPLPISLSKTARTSIGGSKPSTFARFQRFSLAIPMQGYSKESQHITSTTPIAKLTPNSPLISHSLNTFSSKLNPS